MRWTFCSLFFRQTCFIIFPHIPTIHCISLYNITGETHNVYPLVMTNVAIENGHRNSGFVPLKMVDLSIAMLNYQRVIMDIIGMLEITI